jgi:hypothetical protein
MFGQLSRLAVGLTLSAVVIGCGSEGPPPASQETVKPAPQAADKASTSDAQLIADFNSRVANYMDLRNKLKKDAPPLKETKDPARIKASQEVLGQKIREARKDAKAGDIFTPEIRQLFRRLMYPETKGREGAENKAVVTEEKHELKDVALKVNAEYPDTAPLMTVPPDFLAALPRLPEDLEYRFVSKHMILLDVHANLIVDFVPNAIR